MGDKIYLRGHQDDRTCDAVNKGNFIALLNLLAEFDEILNRHLQVGKKNRRYTSKVIQNQLLGIIGNIIREEINPFTPLPKKSVSTHEL